jgi:hypothetical protein
MKFGFRWDGTDFSGLFGARMIGRLDRHPPPTLDEPYPKRDGVRLALRQPGRVG